MTKALMLASEAFGYKRMSSAFQDDGEELNLKGL
jgi:hypothetical protein